MIIYIRHGCDIYDNPTFAHDQKVLDTEENKQNIAKVGKLLREKYGAPILIISSPFQRARDTVEVMRNRKVIDQETKLFVDTRVGRYFSSKEKKAGPEVRKTTQQLKPSIFESWDKFKLRVKSHVDQLTAEKLLRSRSTVVWIITHSLVIREATRYLGINMPDWYEFLQWVAIRSHGANYSASYVAVGNGAADPEILQEEVKKVHDAGKLHLHQVKPPAKPPVKPPAKPAKKEDKVNLSPDGQLAVVQKRKHLHHNQDNQGNQGKQNNQDNQNNLLPRKTKEAKSEASESSSDDSSYDGSGNIEVDEETLKRPKKEEIKPRLCKIEVTRLEEKIVKEIPKETKSKEVFTIDEYVKRDSELKELQVKQKKEARGKTLDEYFTEKVIPQSHPEKVRGNIDDFVKAYHGKAN